MSTRARSAQPLRRTALLLALVCFWISGPIALHHTDESPTFAAGHSALLGHATAPVSPAACAACEWEQAFSHPPAPAAHVAYLPLIRGRYAVTLPAALHSCLFDYTALRGPSSDLS